MQSKPHIPMFFYSFTITLNWKSLHIHTHTLSFVWCAVFENLCISTRILNKVLWVGTKVFSAQHKSYWWTCQRLHWPVEVKKCFPLPPASHRVYRTEFIWMFFDILQMYKSTEWELRHPNNWGGLFLPEAKTQTETLIQTRSSLELSYNHLLDSHCGDSFVRIRFRQEAKCHFKWMKMQGKAYVI